MFDEERKEEKSDVRVADVRVADVRVAVRIEGKGGRGKGVCPTRPLSLRS